MNDQLRPGDPVFHPKFGFGSIHGITRRERVQGVKELEAGGAPSVRTEEYYEISLREGGALFVPLTRAEGVGLRRLTGGVAAVTASLHSPAQSLPDDSRKRAAELRAREQLHEPAALADSVRDFLAQSRERTLSAGEQTWLEKACQRLSIEAAMVDQISPNEALDAIWAVVRAVSGQEGLRTQRVRKSRAD
jgi:RNA polymerase-interacting CarD/CdnL/TRCF family regulator